ncbi:MAG: EAL domain-containing protein [Bacillota bacterium]|nr:EAL domain-containing protein [Bacillota bacterium]
MKNNSTLNNLGFQHYLDSKRETLFYEYQQNKEIRKLLHFKKMNTFFQPILSLKEGCTVGFEVLNRPQSTELFPTTEKFYDFIGKSRDVFFTEQFLRRLSVERYSEQVMNSQPFRNHLVFLNIQPQVLADPTYQSGKTLELLSEFNLSPDQIVLELTEKESVIDYKQFEKIIGNYREQGFRIAVDDAGTGYNSLKTLIYLKPEFIKIDKAIIRHIDEYQMQQHLVELLLEFSNQSETKVIAEGIETLDELRFLQNLGVQMGQGFLLGKPLQELKNGIVPNYENIS